MKPFFWIVFFASLGGMLCGFDTGVISGALLYIKNDWKLDEFLQGGLVSCVLIGAFSGAVLNGKAADILGRQKLILITSCIFLAGSILCAIAPDIYFLIISRFIIGFAIGTITFCAPLYLCEISPKNIRGAVVSCFQLAITSGILISYISNAFFAHFYKSWRMMLLFGAVFALILFCGFLFMPDTPRWYFLKGKNEKAKLIMKTLGLDENEIITKEDAQKNVKFEKSCIIPLLAGITCMFIQQWTGINTIIYYAPVILQNAGFIDNQNAIFASVFIGIVNFLMTFIAVFLTDKIGRKPLLYIGLTGMGLCLLLLGSAFKSSFLFNENAKYFALFAAGFYIMFFAMSLGPVLILIVSEIFPLKQRSFLMSVCMGANFIFNFTVSLAFLPMIKNLGEFATFMFFAIISVFSILFVKFVIPETKGQSLEFIEKSFKL